MVSISTGDLYLEGRAARLELHIPAYEVEEHLNDPERQVLGAIDFFSGDTKARVTSGSCAMDPALDSFRCDIGLEFAAEPAAITVESRLHQILVRNHVFILRASADGASGRAVLDVAIPSATVRFAPPTLIERAAGGFFAGLRRVWTGPAQLLFLLALAIAARQPRELATLALAFIVGQGAACWTMALAGWQPAAAFIEASAALTIAYLALEVILFPEASYRWLVVGVLGAVLGLGFGSLLSVSEVEEEFFLAGAVLTQLAILSLLYWVRTRIPSRWPALRLERFAAGVLAAVGLSWFVYRLL